MGTYDDIDWDLVWRESRQKRSCKCKGRSDWDRKAPSFARRNLGSSYIDRLIEAIGPAPDETVLDVGCGPGTLAIPLAGLVGRVTAIDYSPGMLKELEAEAERRNIGNITTSNTAWEDDWRQMGLGVHDITVASRSLSVEDLGAALWKLNDWAARKVVVTDRVGSGPFDPAVFAAVGRELDAGPDYIITVNMLYSMGINARVDYIPADYSDSYATREEAADSCLWMIDDPSPEERERLDRFIAERLSRQGDGTWRLVREHQPKWAVISWDK